VRRPGHQDALGGITDFHPELSHSRNLDQRCPPQTLRYRDGDGFPLTHQNDKPLTASDAGIEQVTLQHRVMLRHDRDHKSGYSEPWLLRIVRRIGRYQGIKVAEAIGDRSPLELGDQFTVIRLNILHVADVTVVDSLVEPGDFLQGLKETSSGGRPSEYAVNLGGHDEVVLMQSLDLLRLQIDRGVTPTEADIRMMAFSFREFTNLLNKGKGLPEIAKPEGPLDAVSFLRQLPIRGLCMKELGLLARERRYSPTTGSTGFASKSFGHVLAPCFNRRPHE
jgi:hypothetical protein